MARTLRLGHSPDPDDAFMWFPLLGEGLVETGPYRFDHVIEGIESLNRRALRGELEITALSIHAYAHVADRYALLNAGASMGEGYGPVVVASEPLEPAALAEVTVAVPGSLTSAALALALHTPGVATEVAPFDRIPELVASGRYRAGVLIHEGQLTYGRLGLHRVVDLGAWWAEESGGLPLPLGGNAIRRDLGEATCAEVARILEASIRYSLDHREAALTHAMRYGRGLDRDLTDRFVDLYVNRRTLDYGDDGRRAVRLLLARAAEAGLVPGGVEPDFL
ncbi:MAG: ABC transporter substrate-binding protein [Nitrospirae bacterium]|nr:MAG: ABC transporter substrate-binding protein [Nitrospirota bacterium]